MMISHNSPSMQCRLNELLNLYASQYFIMVYEVEILTGTIDEKFITKYDLRIADAVLYTLIMNAVLCVSLWMKEVSKSFRKLKALEDELNELILIQ